MENVMQNIVRRLDSVAIRAVRSVCTRWLQVVDRNLEVLRPSKGKMHTIIGKFPHLTTVDMSGADPRCVGSPCLRICWYKPLCP